MNCACATLQENVFTNITHDSLIALKNNLTSKRKLSELEYHNENKKNVKYVNIAINLRDNSTNLFNKCQRSVSKVVAEQYARSQHDLLKRTT